jgi:CrcB protein
VTALLVALGAAVGAPARLLSAHLLDARRSPLHAGTLVANLVGSALLGWLVGHGVSGHPLALWGTGFCGAFTTYSAVAVQSVDRGGVRGLLYAVATVLGCLGAAWAGYQLGS